MTLRTVHLPPGIPCMNPDASLPDALRLMADRGVDRRPICNGKAPAKKPVRAAVRHDIPFPDEDIPLPEAVLLLHRHGKPLPAPFPLMLASIAACSVDIRLRHPQDGRSAAGGKRLH
jgi:CBS domain-containing protein